jgi:uncharacterized membrane protein YfcA
MLRDYLRSVTQALVLVSCVQYDYDMELFFFVTTIAVACLLQAIVGFGSGLIAIPLSLIYLDKETVVSSMLIVGIALNGLLVGRIRQPISYRLVIILFLPSLAGMPVGVWVLKTMPMNLMKILVGCLVVLFTFMLYFHKITFPKNNLLTPIAGFLSGLLKTSTTMAGPPVLILLAGQKLPKDEFRKTLVSFFLAMGLVSIALFIVNRIMTLQRASFGLVSIPFVVLAGLLGNRIAAKVPQRPFELLALATAFVAGIYNIFSGLT